MTTGTKDSAPAREKRGASPSNSPQTGTTPLHRSRPSPSKTSSHAKSQDSTPSEKQIPNYLKPTISSANDIPKQQGKKPVDGETVHRPSLSRRSFDRPPSASSTQKTRISPNPTRRSSSFSNKTNSAQKSKDSGKQSSLYARPVSSVKKTGTYVRKQDSGSGTAIVKEQVSSSSEEMEVSNENVVPQPETKQEDEESSIAKAEEETPQVESKNEMGTEILVLEDSEKIKKEKDEDVKVETEEAKSVSEQDDSSIGIKTEEPEGDSHIEETGSKLQEIELTTNDCDKNQSEESVSDIPVAEVEEKDEEHREKDGKHVQKDEMHGEHVDNKEAAANGNVDTEFKETEMQEIAGEKKQESVAVKKQVPQGKKDSSVSNDVIEETASKLREQRKNKVKALAGAFETVISLQEPK